MSGGVWTGVVAGEVGTSVAAGAALPSAAAKQLADPGAQGTGVVAASEEDAANQVREPKMSVKKRTATVAAGASR
ncbi:MAG TPA: hypothetical protein PLX70_09990, partial [Solirubrobacterales bacterium]|nr:hypothetical protein [Solirubrobacterales bacterium]